MSCNYQEILANNEKAIHKWTGKPKLKINQKILNKIKILHDTKKHFLIRNIEKILAQKKRKIRVLDFGCGHGGLICDLKIYFGDQLELYGYDVSQTAVSIAEETIEQNGLEDINLVLDTRADLAIISRTNFDVIVSCDVFGHVPDVQTTFSKLFNILTDDGLLIAFSETKLGPSLVVPNLLVNRGIVLDSSIDEHISLHSVTEIRDYLSLAGFDTVKVFPFQPIRFIFYPKRYLKHLWEIRHPLTIIAAFFALFQNRLTELAYNQLNDGLSKIWPKVTTGGALIYAKRIHGK